MFIFDFFIIFTIIIAIFGVVKFKSNFRKLLSLHEILIHVDHQLERPSKHGTFKYVAIFLIAINFFLMSADYLVFWRVYSEDWSFWSHYISRLMCMMILVQYGDLVSNIKDRFRCVNAELQFELANYFRQDILWTITRHEYDKLPG